MYGYTPMAITRNSIVRLRQQVKKTKNLAPRLTPHQEALQSFLVYAGHRNVRSRTIHKQNKESEKYFAAQVGQTQRILNGLDHSQSSQQSVTYRQQTAKG